MRMGQVNLITQPGDNLVNNLVQTLSINPNAAALSGDQTQILTVNYDLSRSSEAAIATVLSPGGIDFSKKLYLDMWVQGDGSAAGSNAKPDADQCHARPDQRRLRQYARRRLHRYHRFHPKGDGTPRTEDFNHNNLLDTGEDIGIHFYNPDGSVSTLGAGNNRLDSEDLDRNGVLDPGEFQRGREFWI